MGRGKREKGEKRGMEKGKKTKDALGKERREVEREV